MTRSNGKGAWGPAVLAMLMALGAARAWAEDGGRPTRPWPPRDRYMMDKAAEIALARSAAPAAPLG